MPAKDGTGPFGRGMKDGRGAGRCRGAAAGRGGVGAGGGGMGRGGQGAGQGGGGARMRGGIRVLSGEKELLQRREQELTAELKTVGLRLRELENENTGK